MRNLPLFTSALTVCAVILPTVTAFAAASEEAAPLAVPEPAALLLLSVGLSFLAFRVRSRKRTRT